MGILFVGKKEVPDILYHRKLEESRILHSSFMSSDTSHLTGLIIYFLRTKKISNSNLYWISFLDIEKQRIREESERDAKDMNLNSVKICFEAFVYENDMSYPICNPVFSRPVANQSNLNEFFEIIIKSYNDLIIFD